MIKRDKTDDVVVVVVSSIEMSNKMNRKKGGSFDLNFKTFPQKPAAAA